MSKDEYVGKMIDEVGKADSSRYISAYYDIMRDVSQAKASYDAAEKAGDTERMEEIKEDKAEDLETYKKFHAQEAQIGFYTRQIKKISADREMDGEEKRVRLDQLNKARALIARSAIAASPQ
jgi:hypothetical protein